MKDEEAQVLLRQMLDAAIASADPAKADNNTAINMSRSLSTLAKVFHVAFAVAILAPSYWASLSISSRIASVSLITRRP